MKKFIAIFIALFALLSPASPAFADIAPPEPAPGTSITPGQETKVRMLAENVLMVVKELPDGTYIVETTADFAMRNLGDIDEILRVRFPLENITGRGDGWGGPADIKNFKVSINGQQVAYQTVEEPYQPTDIPLNWAAFDAAFPVQTDVFIRVRYTTDLQDDSPSKIEYVLGTGAGWFETIGSAAITIRFPYAVGMSNIAAFSGSSYEEMPQNVLLIGNEVRWQWDNYEPEIYETAGVSIVHPKTWQKILALEYQTGARPDDIDAIIELSRTYQTIENGKNIILSHRHANLAVNVIRQALALHPQEIRLHLELAKIYRNWPWLWTAEHEQKLIETLNIILELEPHNQYALEIKKELETTQTQADMTPTATLTAAPTETLEPKPTQINIAGAFTPTEPLETEESGYKAEPDFFMGIILLILGFTMGSVLTLFAQRVKLPR
jgi:hypothetical protein